MFISSIMTDPRYAKLANLLIKYSVELKKNERILLDMIDVPGRICHPIDARGEPDGRHSGGGNTPHAHLPRRSCAKLV